MWRLMISSNLSIVSVDVQFTYTPTYPDEVPKVAVTSHTGLSEQQVEELEAHLNDLVWFIRLIVVIWREGGLRVC